MLVVFKKMYLTKQIILNYLLVVNGSMCQGVGGFAEPKDRNF